VNAREQAKSRPFQHHVIVRSTGFRSMAEPEDDKRVVFQQLYNELIESDLRNGLICADVMESLQNGRTPMVLTERTAHLETLAEMLTAMKVRVLTLRGGMGKKVLNQALDDLKQWDFKESASVLMATGKFIGEGFDDARFDTLFLTLPVSWRGTIAQYVGRLHRLHDGKKVVKVYDYADLDVPLLSRMFDRRCRGYEAVGYTLLVPASALPGWPQSVPLPVDPPWKQQFAASVQRLIADGVDETLAHLFVDATKGGGGDQVGSGGNRARSASEAFFFHRLQTLPETKDHFLMNVQLPIPFNQSSGMEVDFLYPDLRLVIEIDGDQHLSDVAAYRSDRRKDVLLQENGYFVLRFLARDLGENLAEILDRVVRSMEHLRR